VRKDSCFVFIFIQSPSAVSNGVVSPLLAPLFPLVFFIKSALAHGVSA